MKTSRSQPDVSISISETMLADAPGRGAVMARLIGAMESYFGSRGLKIGEGKLVWSVDKNVLRCSIVSWVRMGPSMRCDLVQCEGDWKLFCYWVSSSRGELMNTYASAIKWIIRAVMCISSIGYVANMKAPYWQFARGVGGLVLLASVWLAMEGLMLRRLRWPRASDDAELVAALKEALASNPRPDPG